MTLDELVTQISKLNSEEIVNLVTILKDKWNITNTLVGNTSSTSETTQVEEQQSEFNVYLNDVGPNKITTIKCLRKLFDLGLKEAKDKIDEITTDKPLILAEAVSKDESERIKAMFTEAEVNITIK